MKLSPMLLVIAAAFVLSFSMAAPPALAGDEDCITGSVPEAAADGAQVSAVRAQVDAACPCLQLWNKSSDYVKCTKGVIAARLEAGELRSRCARVLKRLYAKTTCGKRISRHYRPCIEKSLKTGKIKCALKAFTKSDGQTPTGACQPSERADKVPCPAYSNCTDAADTNHDLKIAAPGDDGACVLPPTPSPTPSATPTQTALPTNTPLANGAACSMGSQCASGACVDGVCCSSSCAGSCLACTAAKKGGGSNGVCGAIASGSDPDSECPAEAASTCGSTGSCNGAGACTLHPAGTVCAAGACLPNSMALPPLTCNGGGACISTGLTQCGDADPCTTDSCSGGICTYTHNSAGCDDGAACTINDQCGGGACAGTQITMDLHSGITQEIPFDGPGGFVYFDQQVVTVTNKPFQLTLVDATSPPGFVRESIASNCISDPIDTEQYRCTHDLLWRATSACQGDGTYQLSMQISCSPGVSGCGLCSGTQVIQIGSDTSNWCD
ncbi:MAG TPA: hypothetical protein VEB21_02365 [Terriglobales bacterium]|nr:hypothetical protein [Terriglobales bacterium]